MSSFDLSARYGSFRLEARAAWAGPCVALFGASGSGKSTILEAIAGLRRDVTGSVEVDGERLDGLPASRRRIGWVPQDAALFPHMSVRDNVAFAAPRGGSPRADDLAGDAIRALELERLLDRRTTDLSGGERQRVAIARALAPRPRLLLLDEPLASIDRPLRSRVLPFLERLYERTGVPVFLVTHDPLEVLALADEVLVLEAGRVVESGAPQSVFASASTFGALHSLGAENRFDVRVVESGRGTVLVETDGGCRLSMVHLAGFPPPERVAIRAEDVMLAQSHPGNVSAQNVLPGTVRQVGSHGEQVLVDLDAAGEAWNVKVTRRAVTTLGLEPGAEVFLLVKAHAIVPSHDR